VQIRDPERVMEAYPHELSGGMGQRVMIAMMLIPNPTC
jgi:peptide/nickel transport system ATP-binding protein